MARPSCEEKLKLLIAYQQLTHAHSTAVGDMALINLSGAEYEQRKAAADKARIAAVDARKQLDLHIAEHGC